MRVRFTETQIWQEKSGDCSKEEVGILGSGVQDHRAKAGDPRKHHRELKK